MNEKKINERIAHLLDNHETISIPEFQNATLNLLSILYGASSVQVQHFIEQVKILRDMQIQGFSEEAILYFAQGTLENIKAEIGFGLIGSLQKTVTGEVLTDFLQLSRAALEEKGDAAKNVSAVLSAALFEDTIRRLATNNGISHIEKLADVLTELKSKGILDGTQVGVAQSYLTFRNKSLHAEWDKVGRETVASVLAFTEQLLLKHFS